jgi:hypothetical protein
LIDIKLSRGGSSRTVNAVDPGGVKGAARNQVRLFSTVFDVFAKGRPMMNRLPIVLLAAIFCASAWAQGAAPAAPSSPATPPSASAGEAAKPDATKKKPAAKHKKKAKKKSATHTAGVKVKAAH